MTEPLPPRSAIVETCNLIGYPDIEDMVKRMLKNPYSYSVPINIARRLAELRPDLYPADPDLITLAVREVMALMYEDISVCAQTARKGGYDNSSPFLAIRAVIEKLIKELKP